MVRLPVLSLLIILLLGHFASAGAQGTGTLSVTTVPVSGPIYVDYFLVGARFWSGDLTSGSHVVSFGDVDGYIAPSPQTVTIIANQTYYAVGTYRISLSLLERARGPALETELLIRTEIED